MPKPQGHELSAMLRKIRGYGGNQKYSQKDTDALEECMLIFIGGEKVKTLIEKAKSYKDIEILNINNLKGYDCDRSHFTVQSINPDFKEYSFQIWHDVHNKQIIIYKDKATDHIRLMADELYEAMYEFFTLREKQQCLLDFAA